MSQVLVLASQVLVLVLVALVLVLVLACPVLVDINASKDILSAVAFIIFHPCTNHNARKERVILDRLLIGHAHLTHCCLLYKEQSPKLRLRLL